MAQKRAVRLISKESPHAHTSSLFKQLKLLKLKDQVNLKIDVMMHAAAINRLLVGLRNRFCYRQNVQNNSGFSIRYARTLKQCESIYGP